MSTSGTVIPDYRMPDAVMVPHYRGDLTSLLEEIATRVSRHAGVILLSGDTRFSKAFVAGQAHPRHFHIVGAPFDTPWIRDRSPVAIRDRDGVRWCIPRSNIAGRPHDDRLFHAICTARHPVIPIEHLPHGNLVAGPGGVMLVTRDALAANRIRLTDLEACGPLLGVRRWLVFSGFANETTGHADVHVRFLSPRLAAVAWNLSVKADRARAQRLIDQIGDCLPKVKVLQIPIRSRGMRYASLVNWIQLGRRLVLPRYDLTPAEDIETTNRMLREHGFHCEWIYSPTLALGGSLHCLTASVFVPKGKDE